MKKLFLNLVAPFLYPTSYGNGMESVTFLTQLNLQCEKIGFEETLASVKKSGKDVIFFRLLVFKKLSFCYTLKKFPMFS